MREIKITKGKVVLVDDDEFEGLSKIKWFFNSGYAMNTKCGFMHRVIMKAPRGKNVDHIDGNPLNNQKSNLRFATIAQNAWNNHSRLGVSKYKGVQFDAVHARWFGTITKDGIVYYLGSHRDELEAARKYNERAKELFGEFANLNDIDGYTYGIDLAKPAKTGIRPRRLGSSGYRGVCLDKSRSVDGKDIWIAQIKCAGEKISRRFTDGHAAATWYNIQATKMYGDKAILNNIPEKYKDETFDDELAYSPKEGVASKQRCVFKNGKQWMVRVRKDNKTVYQKNFATEPEASIMAKRQLAIFHPEQNLF